MSLNDWAKNEIDIACNKDILDKPATSGKNINILNLFHNFLLLYCNTNYLEVT